MARRGIANLAAASTTGSSSSAAASARRATCWLAPARETFRKHLTGRGYRPEGGDRAARLGNEAGLIGAADLARELRAQREHAAIPADGGFGAGA